MHCCTYFLCSLQLVFAVVEDYINNFSFIFWFCFQICRLIPSRFAAYYAILNKAFPLDMSQYFRLLNSTRIPLVEKDEFYTVPTARHLVVMKNGNFYAFDVYDKDGKIPCSTIVLTLSTLATFSISLEKGKIVFSSRDREIVICLIEILVLPPWQKCSSLLFPIVHWYNL